MSADTFADTLRREDPARYLASLFAPAPVRANLWALYAFNAEIARIPASVSEAVIGEMRLAWAREALADLYARPPRVRRHPVYEALAILRDQPGAPDEALLAGLVEARNADLGEGAFPDAAERDAYIDRTAGTLMRAGARLCAPDWQPGEEAERALTAAVRLWGYTGLLRDFARLCAAGRPPVTQDELEASGAFPAPMVTEITAAGTFHEAEDHHRNYYARNQEQGYCRMVVRPKIEKFRKVFADKLKDQAR